jgi:hypothetical protein
MDLAFTRDISVKNGSSDIYICMHGAVRRSNA